MENDTLEIVDESPAFAPLGLPGDAGWELEYREWCDDVDRARDAEDAERNGA